MPDNFTPFTLGDPNNSGGYSPMEKLDRSIVVDFYKNKGVPPHVAEGIADGYNLESGLKPGAVNKTSGATGISQDLGSRKAMLFSNPNWENPYVQLEHDWNDLNGGDAKATRHRDDILGAKTKTEAKEAWESYFERPGASAKAGAPAWNVAPAAIASEQARSNTDVKFMTPEEFLAALPPLEDDAASKTKRKNLDDSLAAGDDIQSIPSLEVKPKGNGLTIVDHDGRNRAQAAIDAGVDEIPVAIRGVPKGSDFKFLIDTNGKKLPYAGFEHVPTVTPSERARQLAPAAFTQTPPEIAATPQTVATTQPSAAPPSVPDIAPQAPTKPDYYPEIAAGINKDIINPAGAAYRGVMPPNPTTNATAANRITAANATSAGQVGLPPAQPQSSLNSLLSAINPIGSAQAAEPTSGANFTPFTPPPPAATAGANFTPFTPPSGPSAFDTAKQNTANALGPLTIPANMIAGAVGAPFADAYALARSIPQGLGGAGQNFLNEANRLQALTQLPMTPTQQLVMNIAGAPAKAITSVANWLLSIPMVDNQGNRYNNTIVADTLAPIARLAMDFAPALGASRAVRSAAQTPVRGLLNALVKPTATRAINAINRKYTKELATGGRTQQEFADELAKRRAAGIPAVPADLVTTTGPAQPLKRMITYATEAAPVGARETEKFTTERAAGTPAAPGTAARPIGGNLERLTDTTKAALGSKSARDINADLSKKINVAKQAIAASDKHVKDVIKPQRDTAKKALEQTENALKKREAEVRLDVTYKQALNPKRVLNPDNAVNRDRAIRRLRKDQRDLNKDINRYDRLERQQDAIQKAKQDEIDIHSDNGRALSTGQRLFQDSLRAEDIDKFMSTATPEQKEHFRAGVSDIARDYYGRARELGKEADVFNKQNVKDKLRATFENQASANDFIDGVRFAKEVHDTWKDSQKDMERAGRVSDSDMSRIHRLAESVAHWVWHLASPTHQVYSGSYWGLRMIRNTLDVMRGGGGIAPRVVGDEILRAMYDPQAVISQSNRGLRRNVQQFGPANVPPSQRSVVPSTSRGKPMLLDVPPKPATGRGSTQRINKLTQAITPAALLSLRPQSAPADSEAQQ